MRLALVALLFTLLGGSVAAQPVVGTTGPPATYGDAVRWYERAARAGSVKAQYLLGYMLETGQGRQHDPARAAALYEKAAVQGHARARLRLGWMYQTGKGVARDMAKAAALYARAAAQGLGEAAFNLGYLYDRGDGVPADPEKAATYYRQAAEAGLGEAQLNLGLLLVVREDDKASVKEGYLWLTLAELQTVGGAKMARRAAGELLSSAEIEEIRQRLALRRESDGRR